MNLETMTSVEVKTEEKQKSSKEKALSSKMEILIPHYVNIKYGFQTRKNKDIFNQAHI